MRACQPPAQAHWQCKLHFNKTLLGTTVHIEIWEVLVHSSYTALHFLLGSLIWVIHWLVCCSHQIERSSLVAQTVKCLPAMQETRVWSLGQEDPLEKEMATHSSTLPWKIPWMEDPGRLQVYGVTKSQTRLNDFTFFPWRKGPPLHSALHFLHFVHEHAMTNTNNIYWMQIMCQLLYINHFCNSPSNPEM